MSIIRHTPLGSSQELVFVGKEDACYCGLLSGFETCAICRVADTLPCDVEPPRDLTPPADAPLADALRQAGAFEDPALGKTQAQVEAENLAANRRALERIGPWRP